VWRFLCAVTSIGFHDTTSNAITALPSREPVCILGKPSENELKAVANANSAQILGWPRKFRVPVSIQFLRPLRLGSSQILEIRDREWSVPGDHPISYLIWFPTKKNIQNHHRCVMFPIFFFNVDISMVSH
jgi:hypothetical protein